MFVAFKFIRPAIAAAALTIFSPHALADSACEINFCKGGGKMSSCWAGIKREASLKRKSCKQLVIGSGSSSYAMALSLPNACIKPTAVIRIHRPFKMKGYKAVAIGSGPHNFYFGRITPAAVRFFSERGGMTREGMVNASTLISVPALKTGKKICSRI